MNVNHSSLDDDWMEDDFKKAVTWLIQLVCRLGLSLPCLGGGLTFALTFPRISLEWDCKRRLNSAM